MARQLATITHSDGYAGLLSALQARALERRISLGGAAAAQVAGLPVGYLQKILSPIPKSRKNVRRIGVTSLGPVLGILGVKLVMFADPEAIARYGSKIPVRQERSVRTSAVHLHFSRQFLAKIGALGGANSRKNISRRRARAIAKKAAAARWRPRAAIEATPSVPAPKP
jgi:hypothetical protein